MIEKMINYYTYRGYGEMISGPYKGKRAFIANFWTGISLDVKPEDVPSIFEHYLDYSI